mmetsp:Transcript_2250/g.6028  ORF Transcript_2250/g.6028 Transcript_2250/m.6028 type:complete len:474 (-) Transcript_2250:24-1445(-)
MVVGVGLSSSACASASAGGEHTLFRDPRSGSLYSAGACGLGWCRNHPVSSALFRLRKVNFGGEGGGGAAATRLLFHASYYHNLAVDSNEGRLYTWGCGTFVDDAAGKDGKPNLDGVIPALGPRSSSKGAYSDRGEGPEPIALVRDDPTNAEDPIVGLSAGAYHSVVLTRLGVVYTFGAGQLGQLGRKIASDDATDSSGLPVDPIPAPVRFGDGGEGEKASAVGAGFYNTFAIARSSGFLYCAGENQYEQCGEGPRNLREMVRVKELGDTTKVERAEGGYCHTLVKTVAGQVFSLGCGEEGQRGDGRLLVVDDDDDETQQHAEKREVITPVELPGNITALGVAAGANHSVVLGSDGVAYTFGANDVGQCGVPSSCCDVDNEDEEVGAPVLSPQAVDIPNDAGRVIGVSAGYAHTVLTTSKGRVFVFGQNDNGQLGIAGGDGEKKGFVRNDDDDDGELLPLDQEPSLRPVEVRIP